MICGFRRCSELPHNIAYLVYNAHILSRIRNNAIIWSTCSEEILDKIQVLMNRALKALFRLDWFTLSKLLLQITNTFSLREIVKLERCKFVFNLKNNNFKSNFNLITFNETHRYFTRNRSNIVLEKSKTNYMAKGVLNMALSEFNNLPNYIKNCNSIFIFTKKMKEHLKKCRIN